MSQPDPSLLISNIQQGVSAIADDVSTIADSTLPAHTRELETIRQEQERQARMLADQGEQLAAIQRTLATILQRLDQQQ